MSEADDLLRRREATHGNFARQAAIAQALCSAASKSKNWSYLSPAQRTALEMDFIKTARILEGDAEHPDHWIDKAGYATLIANALSATKQESSDGKA